MTVFLYKGDAITAETFKIRQTDPDELYGTGVYTTRNPGICDQANAHRAYGKQYVHKDKAFEDAMSYKRVFTTIQIAQLIGGRLDRVKIIEYVKSEVLKKYLVYQGQHDPVYVEKIATKKFHSWWATITEKFPVSVEFIKRAGIVFKVVVSFRPATRVLVRRNRFRLTRFEITDREFTNMFFLDENRMLEAQFIEQLLDEGLITGYQPGSNITLHDLVARHQFTLPKRIRFFRLLKAYYQGLSGIKYLGGPEDGPRHQCYVFWDKDRIESYRKS